MKNKLFIIASLMFVARVSEAQQYPLFTNYVINCLGFNPAVASVNPGLDAKFTYRTQWTGINQAPVTQLASLTYRPEKLKLGFGGYFFNDGSGRLQRTGGAGIVSYSQSLSKETTVSVGASMGYFQTKLDAAAKALDPNDPLFAEANKGVNAPDLNVGIYLQSKGLYAGFSVPQFLKRTLSFSNTPAASKNEYERHLYGLLGYRLYLGKMYLEPSTLVKYVKDAPLQWDAAAKFGTGTPLWVGLTFRSGVAGTAMAGIDLRNNLSLAYAYDLTGNGLAHFSKGSHEVTLGMRLFKSKDSDGDGIPDKDDKCPDQPGTKTKDGCPEEEKKEAKCKDTDRDGLCDTEDDCPNVAGPKTNKGCPTDDRDKDGIKDAEDKCPDIPGTRQNAGCPLADRDNDGIRDDLDKCPDEAGPVSNAGCPLGSGGDADGDGIQDEVDECPNTPGLQDRNGCPAVTPEQQEALNLAITNLYFQKDKWVINPTSKPYLDRLAKVMTKNRDWKVRVAGFADARGTDEHNLTLSKNRSEAAMYYLISKGVKREQLVVEYYGEQNPVSHNEDEQGWKQNRRVEMEFIFN
jgi:type IX secretion system PorP/SprF family membrane protein